MLRHRRAKQPIERLATDILEHQLRRTAAGRQSRFAFCEIAIQKVFSVTTISAPTTPCIRRRLLGLLHPFPSSDFDTRRSDIFEHANVDVLNIPLAPASTPASQSSPTGRDGADSQAASFQDREGRCRLRFDFVAV